jgi:large subunit ribosomal protein L23
MNDPFHVIKNIRLTEKAQLHTETQNEYTFDVDNKATKIDIRNAVKALFGKKVAEVRTMRYDGKARRKRRSDAGTTASFKKAVVRLAEGEKIELA